MTDSTRGGLSRRTVLAGITLPALLSYALAADTDGNGQTETSAVDDLRARIDSDATESSRLKWRNASTALFAGRRTMFHVAFQEPLPNNARLNWRWRIGDATAGAGEAEFDSEGTASFEIDAPPLKPGLVRDTRLEVEISPSVDGGRSSRILWLCSPEVFRDRQQGLKSLKIQLFDPQKKTAELFTTANVPFQWQSRIDAIRSVDDGLVILAEESDLRLARPAAETALTLVRRGVSALWIAPTELELPDPAGAENSPLPEEFHVGRDRFVLQLDKRFSAAAWNRSEGVKRWLPQPTRAGLFWRSTNGSNGWSWLETLWPNDARLILCGLPLVKLWDLDPTPRYLLSALLERLQRPQAK